MTRRPLTCWEVEYNCKYLIPEYYANGKLDSVNILLNYWQKKCRWNNNEIIERARLLLSIQMGTFKEENLKPAVFHQLTDYNRNKVSYKVNRYYNYRYYYRQSTEDSLFDAFINIMAKKLKTKQLSPAEQLLSRLYSDSAIVHIDTMIRNKKFDGTYLQKIYKHYKDSILHQPCMEAGLYTGYFNPLGNNKILGNKGIIGVFAGSKSRGNTFDFVLDVKPGSSKGKYNVMYKDSLTATDTCNFFYIGAEYSRALVTTQKSEFYFAFGFGGERLASIHSNDTKKIDGKHFWSPNVSGGLGFKYYYDYRHYFGLQANFNYLNFKNKGGTDITGNAFTIRLIWGVSSNFEKQNFFKYLY